MGARQQPGLERLLAARQGAFEVERADHAILGDAERQIDHRHRQLDDLAERAVRWRAFPAFLAPGAGRRAGSHA